MLDWIISVIHDPHSPVWFSRDIFRSVFQSLLGATASALLVAPLTARWVAWETTRKWRPARRVAFRDIEHGTSLICNSFADWSTVGREAESDDDMLLSCWSIYMAMLEGHEEMKKAYGDWSELWSPQQVSAIIGFLEHVSDLCHHVENESNLINRIIDFDEQPDQLKKGDRWKMVTPERLSPANCRGWTSLPCGQNSTDFEQVALIAHSSRYSMIATTSSAAAIKRAWTVCKRTVAKQC